jgi:hypothetical protein
VKTDNSASLRSNCLASHETAVHLYAKRVSSFRALCTHHGAPAMAEGEARLKPSQAAERPGLGVRQVERLLARYHVAGMAGLVSGKPGRGHALMRSP